MEDLNGEHKIKLPKSFMFVGGSQSGKTYLTKEMLLQMDSVFDPKPEEIIFCYTAWQPCYDELQLVLKDTIKFRQDIPSKEELQGIYNKNPAHRILVLDDKMSLLKDSAQGRDIGEIVCVLAHHCCLSTFILTQNLFHSQLQRELSLNCQHLVIFRNSRSHQQIRILGSQIMPGQLEYFMQSYDKATSPKWGYMWIDLSPDTDPKYRLTTHILPNELMSVYLPIK